MSSSGNSAQVSQVSHGGRGGDGPVRAGDQVRGRKNHAGGGLSGRSETTRLLTVVMTPTMQAAQRRMG